MTVKIHIAVRILKISFIYFNFINKGILYIQVSPAIDKFKTEQIFILLYFYITKLCLSKFINWSEIGACAGVKITRCESKNVLKQLYINFLLLIISSISNSLLWTFICTSTFLENRNSQLKTKKTLPDFH